MIIASNRTSNPTAVESRIMTVDEKNSDMREVL
jgi:hypothetical protein